MDDKVIYFNEIDISDIPLPSRFTFPFFYEPHLLAKTAADQLKLYLENQTELDHNFGLDQDAEGLAIGKMFGILVIQNAQGKLGYLSAFSGKLANANHHPYFVPPVFDMLAEGSFFLKGQYLLNDINHQVKELETDAIYVDLQHQLQALTIQAEKEINDFKKSLKDNKQDRKRQRQEQQPKLTPEAYNEFEALMVKHSLHDKHRFNTFCAEWDERLNKIRGQIAPFEGRINELKQARKEMSASLQQQLFEQYSFLNKYGECKSLHSIFSETVFGVPPSAAGECAAPKLLQYAFLNGFKPIAMAEFWWGASPKSEIRVHGQYYAACIGKCKPILKHMLEGIEMDEDPLLHNPGKGKPLDIVFEDDYLVVVNKPHGLLSVPGINIKDSVYTRLKDKFKNIEPLIIHRLDMATSGLLVVAKTPEAHKLIQRQFLKRTVAKRYAALLSKRLDTQGGEINLPLRGNLDDRPRQLVCFDYGKKAITRWEVADYRDDQTKVHFWPLTGRTHQLRVHAAHKLGLNAAIVGDDLYGAAADRLYLHAAYIEFAHPASGQLMCFEGKEDF